MIYLENEWLAQAKEKLEKEKKTAAGPKEKAMAPAVCDMLLNFCEQDAEFAQAVVQGGSFKDCMTAVAKGVGSSISDMDAYKKAVQFFFPGAEIKMQMSIDLIGAAGRENHEEDPKPVEEAPGEKPETGKMVLNFADFF